MLIRKNDIQNLERIYRLNLINSITGVKPANLIGTRSNDQQDNLAIFSSIVHLGSHPAQIGMVLRPQTNGIRDTFANIQETGTYTINHISQSFIRKAHYTSAKLKKEISEFDAMKLNREFIDGFHAPFVAESAVKIGMNYLKSFDLPNACIFIIGEVALLQLPDELIDETGQIDLESYRAVGISGLNSYYSLKKINSFPHVGRNELPDFEE